MDKLTMDLLRIKQTKNIYFLYLNHGKPKVAMGLLLQPQFIHGICIKLCSKINKKRFLQFYYNKTMVTFS